MTDAPLTEHGGRPALRIVRGSPTPEELAVVTALLAAASTTGSGSDDDTRRGRWNDPAAMHRRSWLPGPGGWQAALR